MEIAVNINKKLWETILKEWKDRGIGPKDKDSDKVIREILMSHSTELIGQKAIDQLRRRFVIQELIEKKPKKPELDEFDKSLKQLNKERNKLNKRINKGLKRSKDDWRLKKESKEFSVNINLRRSTRW